MSNDAAPAPVATERLDHASWCRWWRDLIVERYRDAAFDAVVPLVDRAVCSWTERVVLGRLVEASLAPAFGPSPTSSLVADALAASGFGQPGLLARAPEVRAADHLRSWAPPRPGDEELRLGILGTVADALLAEVPPVVDVDLRGSGHRAGDRRTGGGEDASHLEALIVGATRAAVLAYARHVEDLAAWARLSVLAASATTSIVPRSV
jgi:hypothetical protein